MQRSTLAHILSNPLLPDDLRPQVANSLLHSDAFTTAMNQAILRTSDGGLGLRSAVMLSNSSFISSTLHTIQFVKEHEAHLGIPSSDVSHTSNLQTMVDLRSAIDSHHGNPAGSESALQTLLSEKPPSSKSLADKAFANLRAQLLTQQTSPAQRARLLSAGGSFAGTWLSIFPTRPISTARARHYQLALLLRLGLPIQELTVPLPCSGCNLQHDIYGHHVSGCKKGNRSGLWTSRHDALISALVYVLRSLDLVASHCHNTSGYFPPESRKSADAVVPNTTAPGSHHFFDGAIADPCTRSNINASSSSSTKAGAAASSRAAKKLSKYSALCRSVDSDFTPVVIETFGAVDDHIVGLLRRYCTEARKNRFLDDILDQDADGVNNRDPNFTFNSASLMTYCAGLLTFTTVISHAHMLHHAITIDQHAATHGPPIQWRARKNIHSM